IQRDTCTPMFIVYVGNLGTSVSRGELERAISYYGPLRNVWIVKNPPGFAFVEFEDPRHAEDAVRGLDGRINELIIMANCNKSSDSTQSAIGTEKKNR
uniref:RRM domain-containing protein n=2 Tax=Ursus TaxID=9639 RepID=A0A452VEM9_URSMA